MDASRYKDEVSHNNDLPTIWKKDCPHTILLNIFHRTNSFPNTVLASDLSSRCHALSLITFVYRFWLKTNGSSTRNELLDLD